MTLAEDEWGRLMRAAQDGNGGAYRRLLAEITIWLRRYFTRRLPLIVVDDAVQETLMAVHRNRHTYNPDHPFSPWLGAIAKRKWVDQLRTLKRRSTDELTDTIATPDHESSVTSASVLSSLMNELRPAQARVIDLVKLQGCTIEDASRETGQSVSAVKVNIHRGIARLAALVMRTNNVE
ncbi:sigma-70 family RNA polymerase sigma factor [Sphingomonas ginsenosidivorax]|uniref:Sigma-70 family RNA polymerase sigma factor n=1 Tax=Sphingomonas ginsenosidivorax TaxID=862135 RepID=A0A5C6UID5_9SPHN|nr:sigma-70 family RNA polymerase sigma factor [Sphingomonas ginsenosidivorax]TXC72220.1 sigma-70 family RNA polymerase sigma factor [Sphingomonas ginsenosidivorax]